MTVFRLTVPFMTSLTRLSQGLITVRVTCWSGRKYPREDYESEVYNLLFLAAGSNGPTKFK